MSENLPEGWADATLGDVISGFETGRNLRACGRPATGVEAGVLKISAVTWGSFQPNENKALLPGDEPRPHERIRAGDLLITRANTSDLVGAVVLVDQNYPHLMLPDKILRLRALDNVVDRRFLMYALRTTKVRTYFEHNATGTSDSMRNLSQPKLAQAPIALAPLAEQRRIVAKVEALLAQVNAASERLAKVPVILKRFRQAVLTAACDGRLTEDWRKGRKDAAEPIKENLVRLRRKAGQKDAVPPTAEFEVSVPEGWTVVSVDELALRITSGSRAWKPYYRDDGYGTFVMAQNVRPMHFDTSFRQGVAPPHSDPERERTRIQEHDVLITIVGANTGDVCRVDVPVTDHFVCQSVALVRPALPDLSRYLELWLNSPSHGQLQYRTWLYGEGRPHLGFDHLRATSVALPPLDEQHEILRRVDALLMLADSVERQAAAARTRANKLPQAILTVAFRGELVAAEAELARAEGRTYEPASVLVERSREAQAHRTGDGPKAKRRVRSTAPSVPRRRRNQNASRHAARLSRV